MAGRLDAQRRRDDGTPQYAAGRLLSECGGVRAAADKLRLHTRFPVGKSMLARYADVHTPPSAEKRKPSMPVDIARGLQRIAGKPVITEWLAAQDGYVLIRPQWREIEVVDFSLLTVGMAERAADAVSLGAAAAHRDFTREEAVHWRRRVRALMGVCARLDCALTTRIGSGDADP